MTGINSAFRREKALAKRFPNQTSREKGSARICLAEMAAATPLTAAQKAALKAEFGKVFNGVRVKQSTADALVDHFASSGDSLAELRDVLTLEKDGEGDWRRIWTEIFKEAALSNLSDLERLAKWARARGTDVGASVANHGHAQSRRAIEVLETAGMTVSREVRADIESALAQGDAGSEREQCCCALTVFILYLLRAPTKEEEEWWIEQFNSLGGSEGGQIEITKCPSYAKTHSKTPDSCQTLERALNKGESAFADYSVKVMNTLNRAGMFKAAARFMKILSLAMKQSGGSWNRKRAYLVGYFFEEHTGLGLPVDMAYQSAIGALAVPAGVIKSSDAGFGSEAGSAAGSGMLTDYSRLGGPVNQAGSCSGSAFDMTALAAVIKDSVSQAVEAGLAAGREQGGGGGGKGGGAGGGARKTCMFCRRSDCPMPYGGAPCREANRAANDARLKAKNEKDEKEKGAEKGAE